MHSAILIAVIALITALLRFLPFLIWSGRRKTPAYITYLGKVLPYSIMGMLVVYCLKDISLTRAPFGAPELIAVAGVILLQIRKRNTLISIGLGTVLYMVLVQVVFV